MGDKGTATGSAKTTKPQARGRVTTQPVRTGDRLGVLELGEVLGSGAMATVFRAHDPKRGHDVAVKVLSPSVSGHRDGPERFRREALAVSDIKHPGIVAIFDFVEQSDEHGAYIVEELIQGATLHEILEHRDGPMIPEAAALVIAEIADALQAAHDAGTIHRDIKPANIMVDEGRTPARLVVTDFGVAHMGEMTTLTATGAMIGSPAYMSPEQARGQDITQASDVWALGILLYQLCTGHLPFSGRDPISMVLSISQGQYKRAAQIDARVGHALDAIIVSCLQIDVSKRMTSAKALAAALRRCAEGIPLPPCGEILQALLHGDVQWEEATKKALAEAAVASAKAHIKSGALARALSELGRATAYVSNHVQAERLLATLSSRRQTGRIVLWTGAVVLVVGIGAAGLAFWPAGETPQAIDTEPFARTARERPVKEVPDTPPAEKIPPLADEVPATTGISSAGEPETTTPPRKADHKVRKSSAIAVAVAPRPPARKGTLPTEAPDIAAEAQPVAKPAAIATPLTRPAAAPGRVRLLSRRGFCYPSMDDDERFELPALYPAVAPGIHKVYCTKSRGDVRLLVGQITVIAGGRVERTVVPGINGKPVFSSIR